MHLLATLHMRRAPASRTIHEAGTLDNHTAVQTFYRQVDTDNLCVRPQRGLQIKLCCRLGLCCI